MGTKKYLIDTNAAIDYLGELMPEKALQFMDKVVDNEYYISVISKIELLGFTHLSQSDEQKIQLLLDSSCIIELTNDIVDKTIEIRKKIKMKLPDAIIAATALAHKLILISRNLKDFDKLQNIKHKDDLVSIRSEIRDKSESFTDEQKMILSDLYREMLVKLEG